MALRMGFRLAALCCLCLAVIMPTSLSATRFQVLDSRSGQSRELTVYSESVSNYLDLGELAPALQADIQWESTGQRLALTLEGQRFVFEDLLTFFDCAGQAYQLVAPCRVVRGTFLVPVQFVVEYLPRLLPGRFSFDKAAGALADSGPGKAGAPSAEAARPEPEVRRPAATAPPAARETAAAAPRSDLEKKAREYRIETVMIDPGHGGKDPGALGSRYRQREKDIVLDISRRVVAHLKKSGLGLRVLITRDSDILPPLLKRGEMANMADAGLFVSIHCNANRKSSVRGTSTYFLDAAKTDEERATAMLENAALKHEVEAQGEQGKDDINLILQDMAQNEFLRESKDLSTFIHRELVRALDLPDRGIKQANFAVLRGAYMPAALIETAYISNPQDEGLLRDGSFRERLAGAVADGIIKYIEQYHKKLSEN
ncbi:N-acetylmuramoyl-L-alanine amidase [bacterium]|nr:N-acetylmuramoyl-L-alanine amidase [bacterium]